VKNAAHKNPEHSTGKKETKKKEKDRVSLERKNNCGDVTEKVSLASKKSELGKKEDP